MDTRTGLAAIQERLQKDHFGQAMISTICVLGNHIQSLGIVRIAGRLGHRVIVMNDSQVCISRVSRYCTEFVRFRNESDLLDKLVGRSDKSTLIMPTNDRMVKFIIDNYNILANHFLLSTPSTETLAICYNKKLTYQTAIDLDVPIPESHFPQTLDQLLRLSDRLTYPVIIKPAVMHKLYDREGRKVYVCNNKSELLRNYKKATKIIDSSEIIIQKLIRGMARNLYSYCSFAADGAIYAGFIANRIRQKPMDFGISTTFAIAVSNKDIEYSAMRFLKGTRYFGLSEVEFMYDPDDNTFKLIEVNPRTWKWHTISNKLNVNFIKMLAAYFNGSEPEVHRPTSAKVGWIETITDTYVVLSEILRGRMSLPQYLRSLNVQKEFACFDLRDPLPAIGYVLLLPYLLFSR